MFKTMNLEDWLKENKFKGGEKIRRREGFHTGYLQEEYYEVFYYDCYDGFGVNGFWAITDDEGDKLDITTSINIYEILLDEIDYKLKYEFLKEEFEDYKLDHEPKLVQMGSKVMYSSGDTYVVAKILGLLGAYTLINVKTGNVRDTQLKLTTDDRDEIDLRHFMTKEQLKKIESIEYEIK